MSEPIEECKNCAYLIIQPDGTEYCDPPMGECPLERVISKPAAPEPKKPPEPEITLLPE